MSARLAYHQGCADHSRALEVSVRTALSFTLSIVAVAALGGAAAADAPDEQLTVPEGHGVVSAAFDINLSKESAFKPVSLSPDLWYGVTDDVTLALLHSGRATTGFLGSVGESLCIAGEDNGCASVYSNVALAARLRLGTRAIATAIDASLIVGDFDPFVLSTRLGLAARLRRGKVAFEAAPGFVLGLTERDAVKRDSFAVPLTLSYAATPAVALAVQSGVVVPFDETGDTYSIPLSLGVQYAATSAIAIAGSFSLPVLAGGDAVPTGADVRTMSLGGSYAF